VGVVSNIASFDFQKRILRGRCAKYSTPDVLHNRLREHKSVCKYAWELFVRRDKKKSKRKNNKLHFFSGST